MTTTSTLARADVAKANPVEQIHDTATNLQTRCSRVRSLAEAIGLAADDVFSEELSKEHRQRRLNSIINFAELIEQQAAEVTEAGESIEMLSRSVAAKGAGQ